MTRRVVVTGLGVIAPGGVGAKAFWELMTEGRTATRALSLFDASVFRSRIAAEVDFHPEELGLAPEFVRTKDRAAQFAIAATREAVADSGLTVTRPDRVGVVVGSAVGASTSLEHQYRISSDDGRLDPVRYEPSVRDLYGHFVPSSFATDVAWEVGAEGPTTVVSTGCTSGLDSVGYAAELVREGAADAMVVGSTDAPITPITSACFDAIRATSPRNDDPASASRPFDRTRNGFVLGEGCAMFVLEEREHARARGAHVYGELSGYATRSNAFHMTGLRADGREMAEAIRVAMDQARIAPEEIDYVNAHGSGTKQNDRHETAAFKTTLGDHAYRTPVSSIKSMIGHSLGAIGSIEIAACLLALQEDTVPPTANLTEADPECDLDYVPVTARDHRVDTVLTVGSGFGGFQSAMVLTGPDGGKL